jgi:hypothetical protein
VKGFGEASQQDQVAQLRAARDEGQLEVGGDEGGFDQGRTEIQKTKLEEEETEQLRSEIGDLRAEVERLSAVNTPAAMTAAGGGASAARQRVSAVMPNI